MKVAVITTTINVPHALRLMRYDFGDTEVEFFIAGDHKTPHDQLLKLCRELKNTHYYGPAQQTQWEVSEFLGWNCIQRRNIALLEALRWGADIIVSVDDDNWPLGLYLSEFHWRLNHTFSGICYAGDWFDVGHLLIPTSPHRGFPHTKFHENAYDLVFDRSVGVAAGVCLGDPDISAVDRISRRPLVHSVSELLRNGVVVDPVRSWTVFNSQNTAFVRELAPCMFMWPSVGRYDDIFASLITQRVMRILNYVTHFGEPFVWQQRNAHDLIKDLQDEVDGMDVLPSLVERLDAVKLPGGADVPLMFKTIAKALNWEIVGDAWIKDIESVL